jgi:hypothetical protein
MGLGMVMGVNYVGKRYIPSITAGDAKQNNFFICVASSGMGGDDLDQSEQ